MLVRSLTAEGAVPPGRGMAGLGTQGCIGLQGAAQGQGITLGPTLAMHATGEAGMWGYHAVTLGEGSWRMKPQVREKSRSLGGEQNQAAAWGKFDIYFQQSLYLLRTYFPRCKKRLILQAPKKRYTASVFPPAFLLTSCPFHVSLFFPPTSLPPLSPALGPAGNEAYPEG